MLAHPITNLSQLAAAGARFVEEALHDNPDGPIVSLCIRTRTEIEYQVIIGDADSGDHGRSRIVWHREVTFGMTDATVAGGSAFIEASRTQDRVALYLLELMESRRG